MKTTFTFRIIIVIIALSVLSIACSNGKSPADFLVESSPGISSDLPESLGTGSSSRNPLAVFDAVIDPVSKTFTVTPIERGSQYHFPLTQLYPKSLQVTGYGFTPNFWADIKLTHPFPRSAVDGFDPRIIAILPANPGVSFNYPILGCIGNNKVVLSPDGYTQLFDSLAPAIPGNVNPFMAYFKDQPYRVWSGTGVTEETQRWQMDINGFSGPLQFKLVVDVSTNFPDPSQPIIDNAQEPIALDAAIGTGLMPGGSVGIEVTLIDWQGSSSIGGVQIETPELFDGVIDLAYSADGPNPNEFLYTGTLSNSLLAPKGEYKTLVTAWDQASGIHLYKEFTVNVIENGTLTWAVQAGGANWDKSFAITTLSDDSTVITGYFYTSAIFGDGEPNQTILRGDDLWSEIFLAKYNPDGTLSWAKRAGGEFSEEGCGITSLSDDSTVITGFFTGTSTFGQGESNETSLQSVGGKDIFVARYYSNGRLAWAKRAGGNSVDFGWGITSLSDNSTVVTGKFQGNATFGFNELNETILTSEGSDDIFMAQYTPDGKLTWAKRAGGTSYDGGYGITTLSDNSTVVAGSYENAATFGPGESFETILTSDGGDDIFIAKYNPDGTLSWAKRAGGTNYDIAYGITTLSDNSTAITGEYQYSATFGPGETGETVLTCGYTDIFIALYNTDGTLAWVKSAGGSDYNKGNAITALSDNSLVVTGLFSGMGTFGAGEPNETYIYSEGYYDIFIARYNPDGTLTWARSAGGAVDDEGCGITTLSDNSTIVTGIFQYSATFGLFEPNETVLTAEQYDDIFVARY